MLRVLFLQLGSQQFLLRRTTWSRNVRELFPFSGIGPARQLTKREVAREADWDQQCEVGEVAEARSVPSASNGEVTADRDGAH